jgi:Tol biopolymer transport system component
MTSKRTKPRGCPTPAHLALLLPLALAPGLLASCAETPMEGMEKEVKPADLETLQAVGAKAGGLVAWTSSRAGLPHIFIMKTDGSDTKQLTKGDHTDWRPRFSPDGSKILFQRSRESDFVRESAANEDRTWDLYTVPVGGGELEKVADNATWGNWVGPSEIVFMRGSRIMKKKLSAEGPEAEARVIDVAKHPQFETATVMEPDLSHDGHFVALTLAGGRRQVGIYNVKKKVWTELAQGKQIEWAPDGASVYWIEAAGREGGRIAREPVVAGVPADDGDPDKRLLVDLGGKRSRESFPRLSNDGKWLVFAAAVGGGENGGLENDLEDYELFLWEVGTPSSSATRLTFHTANDRWPDIFIGEAGKAAPAAEAAKDNEGAKTEEPESVAPAAPEPENKKAAAPAEESEPAPAAAGSEETTDDSAAPTPPAKAKGKKKKRR